MGAGLLSFFSNNLTLVLTCALLYIVDTSYWDWRPKGNCSTLKPEQADRLFFPESGRSINKAKAFCQNCPVMTLCLEYALDNQLSGIWAGTSGEERKQILNFRRQLSGVVTPRKIIARRNISFS